MRSKANLGHFQCRACVGSRFHFGVCSVKGQLFLSHFIHQEGKIHPKPATFSHPAMDLASAHREGPKTSSLWGNLATEYFFSPPGSLLVSGEWAA